MADRVDLHVESGNRITGNDRVDAFVGNTGLKDVYNYTSVGLTFRLGEKSRGIQWRSRPVTTEGIRVTPMQVPPAQTPPQRQEQAAQPERTTPPPAAQQRTETTPAVERTERITAVADPHAGNTFFVILGSFRVRDNAYRFADTLRGKGFQPAVIIAESGLFRVMVDSYPDRNQAVNRIREIRARFPEHNDAWLLIREK